MLSPRLNNCKDCNTIPKLLEDINCTLSMKAIDMYNNIVFILNKPISSSTISSLLHYKRILTAKYCNPNYVSAYTVEMIASKVRLLTVNCKTKCNCEMSKQTPLTTTTTSTSTSTTTSTTTTSIPIYIYNLSAEYATQEEACANPDVIRFTIYSRSIIGIGAILYTDGTFTTVFEGVGGWYRVIGTTTIFQLGVNITATDICLI